MHDAAPLIWRVHPARQRPAATAAVLLTAGTLGWLTAALMGHPAWAAFAILFLAAALHRFFLPTEYRVDHEGVAARSLLSARRLNWCDIRRFDHGRDGGFVATRVQRSAFDGGRGVSLLFAGNGDEVVAAIQAGLATQQSNKASETCIG